MNPSCITEADFFIINSLKVAERKSLSPTSSKLHQALMREESSAFKQTPIIQKGFVNLLNSAILVK